jgi:hypothetical protein
MTGSTAARRFHLATDGLGDPAHLAEDPDSGTCSDSHGPNSPGSSPGQALVDVEAAGLDTGERFHASDDGHEGVAVKRPTSSPQQI